ncbi:MAG: hypothetical protein U0S36_07195 [Candidatus Nanopelagicales bacterium]
MLLEQVTDPDEQAAAVEALHATAPRASLHLLVGAVSGLERGDAFVDDFLRRVLLDVPATADSRNVAATGLAWRGSTGWEPMAADALVAHGPSPGQRLSGMVVLARYGTVVRSRPRCRATSTGC